MRFLFAEYNKYRNSIDVYCCDNTLLRLYCEQVEEKLITTPYSQLELDSMAVDHPLEYAGMALDFELQVWIDAVDNLDML